MPDTDAAPLPRLHSLPPALLCLAIHLPVWGLLLAFCVLSQGVCNPSMPWICLTEGAIAWAVSRWLGLPPWWQLINLVFFPLVWAAGRAELSPLWYLAAFAALALTSLGSVRTRVPLYLSSAQAMKGLAARLPHRPGLRIVDLGSGLGDPLAQLSRLRPDLQLHGVEAAPLSWLISRLRLGRAARVRLGSLWDEDLSDYDVVYAYLSPAPMARLWDKARREMRPGSLLVSNSFEIPGVPPDEVLELDDFSHSRLLLWRMP